MTESHTRTQKLYLADPYTTTFQAKLLRCETLSDGRIAAVLDKTYFYPESGGQRADRGTVANVEIADVWEDENEVVYHGLAEAVVTGSVDCQIDWARRFDHMQQHTGQHVLSRAFIETGSLQTVSFHMGDEICTIDLEGDGRIEDCLESAEMLANQIVWENREVIVRIVARDELDQASLRKSLPDAVTEVRLVEVESFDVIGCCGTHVRHTGELGLIKVLKHEKAKGAQRVFFKVGTRAFDDFKQKHDICKQLSNRFTTSVDGIEEKIDKLQSDGHTHRKNVQRLGKKLAAFEGRKLAESAETNGDVKFIVEVFSGEDDDYLKLLSAELKNGQKTVALLGSSSGRAICVATNDLSVDFSKIAVEPAKELGGGGGGKGNFATVQFPEGVDVKAFLEKVRDAITGE